MVFKTSVNIRFDVGKEEFINRYIPTPSHTEVLKGILDGFLKESNRAHIVVGAYGTGKSLLATVVSSIVSKNADPLGVEKLIKKFVFFDDYIANQFNSVNNLNKRYVPVLLTGNEGRFRQAILSNVVKALKKEGLEVVLPGVSKKILESVKLWEERFPQTYSSFLGYLESYNKDISSWKEEIKNQNEKEISFFSEIYPLLTSGATFEIGYTEDFLEQMGYISKLLNANNLGLMIVYDEFGRFLQGLNNSSLNETMQDIQDLAELTDREKSLHFMLITHKSLRQYFGGNQGDIAKEFQRIEKRFRQYNITSDQATFLKIAEVIMTENIKQKPVIPESTYNDTLNSLKNYSLFPSLNPNEREQIIVRSMYPLHPVTLFVLPQLSSIFGQNERTLFTFLESEETGGLLNHITKTKGYYKPHQLFDYFFSDTSGNDVDPEVSKHLLLYKKAVARIPDNLVDKKLAFQIIKFLSIWSLCGLQNEQKITTDFLKFAIQEIENIDAVLETLANHKVIRFNRLNEHWELHSGSAIDIQEQISDKKSGQILTNTDIHKILLKNLSRKYFFPEKYNDDKEMTRFANIELLLESDLQAFDKVKLKNNINDLTIYYVIPEDSEAKNVVDDISKLSGSHKDIFVIHPKPLSSIKEEILESVIIETLTSDKELLSEDKGIKEELTILLKEVNYVINRFLSLLTNFDQNLIWVSTRKRIPINSSIELSELLSEKCYQLYGESPKIINDSFNRMNSSSQQISGAKLLIDQIIKAPTEDQFGVSGNGPAYAIYASIFKNNFNFDSNIRNLDYSYIEYGPYKKMREKLVDLLDKQPKGNFSDIIDIFAKPPFGIRKPVILILLVAMLRDRWNEFMLYRNEIFVPGLNGSKLYEILEEEGPENYQYVYEHIDEEFIKFFNTIENFFHSHIEDRLEGQHNSRLIQICGTLLKWLRSLPRFTQISESVDQEFRTLRDLIRRTEVKPQKSISDIYSIYHDENILDLLRIKEYAENFILVEIQGLKQVVLENTGTKNFEQLRKWADSQHEYLKKNSELVRSILSIKTDDWVGEFAENFSGVRVEDWSDKTKEKFIKDIEQGVHEINRFYIERDNLSHSVKETPSSYYTVQIGNKSKVINKVEFSVKAKTVYTNIDRIIKNAGRNIPKNELEYMIYLLMEEHIE
ncbi:hypothetical protein [Bacillus sp. FJAT-27445]|uniref:hypothetical protein n=1 Tax=Bacillus sp. FJAT-27445 TaxID=1679166 RepID=UPI0007437E0A|nr:hypothetical protein [Bacillus sp. FJAT-27445]